MSWTFLSRFNIKPDHEAEFVTLIPAMEANAASEPGTLAYKFYRLDAPHAFAVFESFVDEAADQAHQANPASTDIITRMIDCIDGTYTRDYLRPV
nr:antibiotic biosynthesis monooxygenase [Polymorphobacter sp.]